MVTDLYQVHLRLGDEIVKQVDRYIAFVKNTTGVEPSRVDAVLALVRRGIVAWDQNVIEASKSSRK